jgi:hypothetical protein
MGSLANDLKCTLKWHADKLISRRHRDIVMEGQASYGREDKRHVQKRRASYRVHHRSQITPFHKELLPRPRHRLNVSLGNWFIRRIKCIVS